MKTIIRLLKIVLPVGLFVVLLSPVSASIETPSYVGLCNPTSVTLSGNGVGEIKVDGLRVNDANGDWSVNLSIKNGSHNVSVDTESLDFNVPKCPEGGGIIGAVPCLGIFGPIGDACRAQNQSKVRFLSAGTGNCPVWMTGGCNTTENTDEQKLIEGLQKQIVELQTRILAILSARR